MSENYNVNSIVIVGGGTSGWMTAAALSHYFCHKYPSKLAYKQPSITVIESSQLGTIGVGEATIPTLRRFYQKLGFTDAEVIKATNATCKLGIEFKDWCGDGKSFIHPFGLFGQGTKEVDFHHYWFRSLQESNVSKQTSSLADFSLGVNLAKENKFFLPPEKPNSQLDIFDWALHFDATLFADLMRDYAINNGVSIVDSYIEGVALSHETGNIASLAFNSGNNLSGDLFIDCSGFKALLIEGALKTGFENWGHWLLCDSALAVQSNITSAPIARTIARAQKAGWQWHIPLQNRMGNGYVYCSKYMTQTEATESLLKSIDGEVSQEVRSFSFTPGRRKKAWNKNCIAIGLASGFIEPLESTSIALVETAIEKILLTFDTPANNSLATMPVYSDDDVNRFNEVNALEYERVRDFVILHYKLNQRNDGPMWQYCRDMSLPESLMQKMQKFKHGGEIIRYPWEMFGKDSWLAIFDGFNYYPETYDKRVNNMDRNYLQIHLNKMRKIIATQVNSAPKHGDFLAKHRGLS